MRNMELPEAITIANQMNNELNGKTIVNAHFRECEKLIKNGFMNLQPDEFGAGLTGKNFSAADARGKWILVRFETDYLLLAPEMGGSILYHSSVRTLPEKYHLKLDFSDGSFLTIRIFGLGFLRLARDYELESLIYPKKLGVSPVDEKKFTQETFLSILTEHEKKAVKNVLLDQKIIAGIANGYLQDILFKAKIHPKRKIIDMDEVTRRELFQAVKEVLTEAVTLGGKEGECDLYNKPGGYRRIMDEDRNGKPCPVCGAIVVKQNIFGSSSYVCPSCQKE